MDTTVNLQCLYPWWRGAFVTLSHTDRKQLQLVCEGGNDVEGGSFVTWPDEAFQTGVGRVAAWVAST